MTMILRSIDLSFTVFMAAFFDLSMSSYMVEMSAEEAFSFLQILLFRAFKASTYFSINLIIMIIYFFSYLPVYVTSDVGISAADTQLEGGGEGLGLQLTLGEGLDDDMTGQLDDLMVRVPRPELVHVQGTANSSEEQLDHPHQSPPQ